MAVRHFDPGDGKARCEHRKHAKRFTGIGRDVTCIACRRTSVFLEKTELLTHFVRGGGIACGKAFLKEAFVIGHVEYATCPECKAASR